MSDRTRHVVAFYEIDRAWGGPEEGGWWYDCGELARILKVVPSADAAHDLAARANRLMDRLQRGKRDVGSVIYAGGRYAACVLEDTAPRAFPETRPHYE
ncbi:hypothetical protein LX81_03029 [Palleronia aestuarii]|uniref:Uncharacterized protein n=1 Tax=Palleronia aestuarii TaxID=568105 RepID=A0A2W7N2E7_9RHOB|nr:hypothetical protein [Palleronia aestuarii]PZX14230.1 hypothetical protein LX81_03029 [Palleronia aestuarii]